MTIIQSSLFFLFFFCVPTYLGCSPFLVRCLRMWSFFKSNHRGSHIPSSWMVLAGCVFVAGIHPSRTWMSGPFESIRRNACVYRLHLGWYSHPKEFWGKWSQNSCFLRGKNPLYRKLRRGSNPRRCITQDGEPNTLPTELFLPRLASSAGDPRIDPAFCNDTTASVAQWYSVERETWASSPAVPGRITPWLKTGTLVATLPCQSAGLYEVNAELRNRA